MDIFFAVSIGVVVLFFGFLYKYSNQWQHCILLGPLVAFIFYGSAYGMTPVAWQDAQIFAAFCAVFVFIVLVGQHIIYERLLMGINLFFVVGAYGLISGNEAILSWYSQSNGGPVFSCIALVGVWTILFTKTGFIGVVHKKSQAIQYASFLLLAATIIALIWSIRSNDQGIFVSVVAPFILLGIVREMIIRQMD